MGVASKVVGQVMKGQRWERTGGWQNSLVRALKPADHEVGETEKMVWDRARCYSQHLG